MRGDNSSIYNMKLKTIFEKYEKIIAEIDTESHSCQQLVEILKKGSRTMPERLDTHWKAM